MHINKSGMKAQQLALDAISNNIANVSTTGYKAKGVRFQSLIENAVTEEDVILNDINPSIAAGARAEIGTTDFSQGTLLAGGKQLDLSLIGEGYFGVTNNNGDFYLTRDGSFMLDEEGQLVNNNGDYLVFEGNMALNPGAQIQITGNGQIVSHQNGTNEIMGTITVFMPENESSLLPVGQNYYIDPTNQLNTLNNAQIESSILEASNVDLANELTNMIIAQRAYGLNVRVAQGTDEMMSLINQFSM